MNKGLKEAAYIFLISLAISVVVNFLHTKAISWSLSRPAAVTYFT